MNQIRNLSTALPFLHVLEESIQPTPSPINSDADCYKGSLIPQLGTVDDYQDGDLCYFSPMPSEVHSVMYHGNMVHALPIPVEAIISIDRV